MAVFAGQWKTGWSDKKRERRPLRNQKRPSPSPYSRLAQTAGVLCRAACARAWGADMLPGAKVLAKKRAKPNQTHTPVCRVHRQKVAAQAHKSAGCGGVARAVGKGGNERPEMALQPRRVYGARHARFAVWQLPESGPRGVGGRAAHLAHQLILHDIPRRAASVLVVALIKCHAMR